MLVSRRAVQFVGPCHLTNIKHLSIQSPKAIKDDMLKNTVSVKTTEAWKLLRTARGRGA